MTGTDFDFIKNLLVKVYDQQDEIKKSIQDVNYSLNALNTTVIGNEIYGQKGLVKEVSDLKRYIESDKKLKNRVIGGLSVVGVVWTFLLELWKKVL